MIRHPRVRTVSVLASGFVPLSILLASACNQPPAVNPWRDDSIPASEWSTPSREGILTAGHEPAVYTRDFPPIEGPYVSRDTPHYPLWWEDPFEDKGDGDNVFAWTYADYLAMPYSPGRYLLNTMGWPVSAVVTPPGVSMVSDGRLSKGGLGYDHDAEVGRSPNPTATDSDFRYLPRAEPGEPGLAGPEYREMGEWETGEPADDAVEPPRSDSLDPSDAGEQTEP